MTAHVLRQDGRFRGRKCAVVAVDKRRKVLKLKAVEYKGGKCSVCGYCKCYDAMDFHHIDPSEKDFEISGNGSTKSWANIMIELDKCSLLCANCHREEHAASKPGIQYSLTEVIGHPEIIIHHEGRAAFTCGVCDKQYILAASVAKDQKYCSDKCCKFDKRKVDWPTKDDLSAMLLTTSVLAISRKYGVSDNTIRKWSKSYGLETRRKKQGS
jgi:hypothetical protein